MRKKELENQRAIEKTVRSLDLISKIWEEDFIPIRVIFPKNKKNLPTIKEAYKEFLGLDRKHFLKQKYFHNSSKAYKLLSKIDKEIFDIDEMNYEDLNTFIIITSA